MFDVALLSAGAQIALSTSCDENYPPENMIDGKSDTFWMTTGLFPQEVIISFQSLMNLNSIKLESTAVRQMRVERSVQNEPADFEEVTQHDFESNDGGLQREDIPISNCTAMHLKLTIPSAYDHFISIHRVHVDGNAVHN